jgi:hypothetical protein
MRSDLKELDITIEELKQITGMDDTQFGYYEIAKSKARMLYLLGQSLVRSAMKQKIAPELREMLVWFYGRKAVHSILDKVSNYRKLIKAIDINDQLEEAGNFSLSLSDRQKVLEALKFTRDDLIRALKTEKILRENKEFIDSNPHMFAHNLANLQALQVSEQASEYGRILDETLQVAVSIQQELKKLRNG